MNPQMLQSFFMWSFIINYSILLLWFFLFTFLHDPLKNFHEKVMRRRLDHYDNVHYVGMAAYKIGVILFNLVPWIALNIVV